MEATEQSTEQSVEAANAASLQAIKDAYLTVVRNMRHGPWISCD